MADHDYPSEQNAARRFDVSGKTIDRLRSSGVLERINIASRVRIAVT